MKKAKKLFVPLILTALSLIFFIAQARSEGLKISNSVTQEKRGSSGEQKSVSDEKIPVIEQFAAEPSSISLGMKVTLNWRVKNATMVGITPGVGMVNSAGSISLMPSESMTYILTALSNSKMVKQNLIVTVTPPQPPPPPPGTHSSRSTSATRTSASRKGDKLILRQTFAKGSAVLPASAHGELKEVTDKLLQSPATNVEILGYADYAGKSRQNSKLSLMRAVAVRDYLCEKGVQKKQITVRGISLSQPKSRKKKKQIHAISNQIEIKVRDMIERN